MKRHLLFLGLILATAVTVFGEAFVVPPVSSGTGAGSITNLSPYAASLYTGSTAVTNSTNFSRVFNMYGTATGTNLAASTSTGGITVTNDGYYDLSFFVFYRQNTNQNGAGTIDTTNYFGIATNSGSVGTNLTPIVGISTSSRTNRVFLSAGNGGRLFLPSNTVVSLVYFSSTGPATNDIAFERVSLSASLSAGSTFGGSSSSVVTTNFGVTVQSNDWGPAVIGSRVFNTAVRIVPGDLSTDALNWQALTNATKSASAGTTIHAGPRLFQGNNEWPILAADCVLVLHNTLLVEGASASVIPLLGDFDGSTATAMTNWTIGTGVISRTNAQVAMSIDPASKIWVAVGAAENRKSAHPSVELFQQSEGELHVYASGYLWDQWYDIYYNGATVPPKLTLITPYAAAGDSIIEMHSGFTNSSDGVIQIGTAEALPGNHPTGNGQLNGFIIGNTNVVAQIGTIIINRNGARIQTWSTNNPVSGNHFRLIGDRIIGYQGATNGIIQPAYPGAGSDWTGTKIQLEGYTVAQRGPGDPFLVDGNATADNLILRNITLEMPSGSTNPIRAAFSTGAATLDGQFTMRPFKAFSGGVTITRATNTIVQAGEFYATKGVIGSIGLSVSGATTLADVSSSTTAAFNNQVTTGSAEFDTTVNLAGRNASKILRTDGSKNIGEVTIGSNLSFDGTTLSATGGGSGGTNYPPVIALGGGGAGTNVAVGSGVRQYVTVTTNATFNLNFQGTPLNGESIRVAVSNYSSGTIYMTNRQGGTVTGVYDPTVNSNVTAWAISPGIRIFEFTFHTNFNLGSVRQELQFYTGLERELAFTRDLASGTNGGTITVSNTPGTSISTIAGVGGANTNFTGYAEDGTVYIDAGTTNVNFVAVMPGPSSTRQYYPTYILTNLTATSRQLSFSAVTNRLFNLMQYSGITLPITLTNKHTGILSLSLQGTNTYWAFVQATNGF